MVAVVPGQGGQSQSVFPLTGLVFLLFRRLLWLLAGGLTTESGNSDSDEELLEVMGSKQIWRRVYMWSQQDLLLCCMWPCQVALAVKNPPDNAGDVRDVSSVLGWGRSPGGGHRNPLLYSSLENLMDRGAWRGGAYSPQGCKELDMTQMT